LALRANYAVRRILGRGPAQRPCPQRLPTPFAHRSSQRREGTKALLTNWHGAGTKQHALAQPAARWKENADQSVACPRKPVANASLGNPSSRHAGKPTLF